MDYVQIAPVIIHRVHLAVILISAIYLESLYFAPCSVIRTFAGIDFAGKVCYSTSMEIQTIFGALAVTYYLSFADCGVICEDEEFTDLDRARDCAFEISAETMRKVNVIECFGASEHLVEQVLA